MSLNLFVQTAIELEVRKREEKYKAVNKLGVPYARYGLYDQAETEFKQVVEQQEYLPAPANLGNINYLGEDYPEALEFYERAEALETEGPWIDVRSFDLVPSESPKQVGMYNFRTDYPDADPFSVAVKDEFVFVPLSTTDDGFPKQPVFFSMSWLEIRDYTYTGPIYFQPGSLLITELPGLIYSVIT